MVERFPLLRAATYNVHSSVGTDGRHDARRVAAVIRQLESDVVGLQEVDAGYRGRDDPGLLESLEQFPGVTTVRGPTLFSDRGTYGNVLLTRCPIRYLERHDLGAPRRRRDEPRGVIDAELECEGLLLRVVVTHLGPSRRERRRQAVELGRVLDQRWTAPLVLLGDLNEWMPGGGQLRKLLRRFDATSRTRTFPSWRPLLPLDRVCVRPAGVLASVAVHDTPLARQASDHLPVRAVLRVPPIR